MGFPEMQVDPLEPGGLARAARAVAACPRRALSVDEMIPMEGRRQTATAKN